MDDETQQHASSIGLTLTQILKTLQEILQQGEGEDTFDQTFVFSFTATGALVFPFQLPRTLSRVEIELTNTGPAGTDVALLQGNVPLAQAQGIHAYQAQGSQSAAMVVSSSGKMKVRDYLDQSGWLTLYLTSTFAGSVMVRVRALKGMTGHRGR